MTSKVLAIIPAKARSRRLPNKNLKLFHGKPLIEHTIQAALEASLVDEVYVSTDSEAIRDCSIQCGARVPFLRPPEHCGDDVHSSVPILDMLQKLGGASKYAYCVMLLPTSPLRPARVIDAVVRLAQEKKSNVISVTPFEKTLWHLRTIGDGGRLQTVTNETVYNFSTDEAAPLYYFNGAAYCAPVGPLLEHGTFQYGNPAGYVMEAMEGMDIDNERDFYVAEKMAEFVANGKRT